MKSDKKKKEKKTFSLFSSKKKDKSKSSSKTTTTAVERAIDLPEAELSEKVDKLLLNNNQLYHHQKPNQTATAAHKRPSIQSHTGSSHSSSSSRRQSSKVWCPTRVVCRGNLVFLYSCSSYGFVDVSSYFCFWMDQHWCDMLALYRFFFYITLYCIR